MKNDLLIIGVENCRRCSALRKYLPDTEYISMPDKCLGLGDVIHRITLLFSIEKCAACWARHLWLNKWFPFFWRGNRKIRITRAKMLKLKATIYPVLTDTSFSRTYNIDDFVPGFSAIYPPPK